MITGVSRVVLEVDDQDEAKAFWIDKMGFELAYDETFGDERWVEVRPPSGSPILVLGLRPEGEPRPPARDELPMSNVFFTCDDVRQTYEDLSARGVKFPTPPEKMHWGWWGMFEDHAGTRYAISVTDRD